MSINSSSLRKKTALMLVAVMVMQSLAPVTLYALEGPSDPSVAGFVQAGVSDLVDPSSGTFTYNVSLMSVDGYPINLAYQSGSTMESDASEVGLGWKLNAGGAIERNIRGIPDDAKGDIVTTEMCMKPHRRFGGGPFFMAEFVGKQKAAGAQKKFKLSISGGTSMSYDNYTQSFTPQITFSPSVSIGLTNSAKLNAGFSLSSDPDNGLSVAPSLSVGLNMSMKNNTDVNIGLSASFGFSSRTGAQAISWGGSMGITNTQYGKDKAGNKTAESAGAGLKFGGDVKSFSTPTYYPQVQFPMVSTSIALRGSIGTEVVGWHPGLGIQGYYNEQRLRDEKLENPAYGFLYAEAGDGNPNAMQDFNWEKDGTHNEHTMVAAIPIPTNDIFSASGQGASGSFQLWRSDAGTFSDPVETSMSMASNGGVEVGIGGYARSGADFNMVNTMSASGIWSAADGNLAQNGLQFTEKNLSSPDYEPAYFKMMGELDAETDPDFFKALGGFDPVKTDIINVDALELNTFPHLSKYPLTNPAGFFKGAGTPTTILTAQVKRKKRDRRNQLITYLTAGDAKNFALDKKLNYYKINDFSITSSYPPEERETADRKRDHLSEITMITPDGTRYIYGLPVYNFKHEEVVFNVNQPNLPNCDGLVSYAAGDENTLGNKKGKDWYYRRVIHPPAAYGYLLTAVLPADYKDTDNDGLTPRDGAYTKINYTKIHNTYRWRLPVAKDKANYDPADHGDHRDDKGNYAWGEKEKCLVHSIEGPTQVAQFYYSTRDDGHGVLNENGGIAPTQKVYKLDSIALYSKQDKLRNPTSATPIITAHMSYNHDFTQDNYGNFNKFTLCPCVPNNTNTLATCTGNLISGKLTLARVWFTYGHSKRGSFSKYDFKYGGEFDDDNDPSTALKPINPPYDKNAYNRWGTYQPNDCNPNPAEFPYVPQLTVDHPDAETDADMNAHAFQLTQIKTPADGIIRIHYEAHRYKMVMEKRAMQPFKIAKMSAAPLPLPSLDAADVGAIAIYEETSPNNFVWGSYVYFPLTENFLGGTHIDVVKKYIKENYLGDMADAHNPAPLYFKCYVKLDNASNHWDYVRGYAYLDLEDDQPYGAVETSNGDYKYGYVKIRDACIKARKDYEGGCKKVEDRQHPFAVAAANEIAANHSELAYGFNANTVNTSDVFGFVKSLVTMIQNTADAMIKDINKALIQNGFAKELDPDRSFIRLYNPNQNKLAGGQRVKKITFSDEFGTITGNSGYENAKTGQEYDYTEDYKDGILGTRKISSGVASWEPALGGDINPYRLPLVRDGKNSLLLAPPSNGYFQELPLGESLYPAPVIVYSRVKVTDLRRDNGDPAGTGYSEYRYFTAADFPTRTKMIIAPPYVKKSKPVKSLFKREENTHVTQGIVVYENNMHGKLERHMIYDENGSIVSGTRHYYNTKGPGDLDNEVTVVDRYGNIKKNTLVGLDYYVVSGARQSSSKMSSSGMELNLDVATLPLVSVPVPMPSVWPSFSKYNMLYRSMSTTKYIHQAGILEKVVTFSREARITTHNVVYDEETGQVVVSSVDNEFKDRIYQLSIPAYWAEAYKGMGPSVQNVGVTVHGADINNGIMKLSAGMAAWFKPGDEISISGIAEKAWVTSMGSSYPHLQYADGSKPHGISNSTVTILRSGYRNMQTLSMGTVTLLDNPALSSQLLLKNPALGTQLPANLAGRVLDASAVEYSDEWEGFCECGFDPAQQHNPYVRGERGIWRLLRDWFYLADRTQSEIKIGNAPPFVNARTDGTYQDFVYFWMPAATGWLKNWNPNVTYPPGHGRWVFRNETTHYNPYAPLENVNPLNIFTAATYGYGNQVTSSLTQNAQYREVGFDGFEDYYYEDCPDAHFGFRKDNPGITPTEQEAHTGRYSLKVGAGDKKTLKTVINPCKDE